MSQLIIDVDSKEDKDLILALSARLKARVITLETDKTKKAMFLQALHNIAERGGVGESFGDASEWQRETRADRPLANRDE